MKLLKSTRTSIQLQAKHNLLKQAGTKNNKNKSGVITINHKSNKMIHHETCACVQLYYNFIKKTKTPRHANIDIQWTINNVFCISSSIIILKLIISIA